MVPLSPGTVYTVFLIVIDVYSNWLEWVRERHVGALSRVIASDNNIKIKTMEFHTFCTANTTELFNLAYLSSGHMDQSTKDTYINYLNTQILYNECTYTRHPSLSPSAPTHATPACLPSASAMVNPSQTTGQMPFHQDHTDNQDYGIVEPGSWWLLSYEI